MAAEHPRVVLVEDDETLERELTGALMRALPEIEVRCTADPDLALQLVCDNRSRVLITEAQSAVVDGLSLAACARHSRSTLPLIFLSDLQGAPRSRMACFDGSHVFEKPPHLAKLVRLVARIVRGSRGFRGELTSHDLIELVQLVAMTMPTGALHLSAPEGQGTLWFDEGMVVHVSGPFEQGISAFRDMLSWTGGDFILDAAATSPVRTITLSTTQLLLEGTRTLDEENFATSEDSGTKRLPRSAVEHFERGLLAVHERRYGDALPEWERALELDRNNRIYQHNLRRLRDLLLVGQPKALGGRE